MRKKWIYTVETSTYYIGLLFLKLQSCLKNYVINNIEISVIQKLLGDFYWTNFKWKLGFGVFLYQIKGWFCCSCLPWFFIFSHFKITTNILIRYYPISLKSFIILLKNPTPTKCTPIREEENEVWEISIRTYGAT